MPKNHWDTTARNAAREMGYQFRRNYLGLLPPSAERPAEYAPPGYAPRDILGKIREEGLVGASQGYDRQIFREYFTGEALRCRRAMQALEEKERVAVFVHFAIAGEPVKVKAHALNWKLATYYWRLNRGMTKLAKALQSLEQKELDVGAGSGDHSLSDAVLRPFAA